jgi:hypothetical protein
MRVMVPRGRVKTHPAVCHWPKVMHFGLKSGLYVTGRMSCSSARSLDGTQLAVLIGAVDVVLRMTAHGRPCYHHFLVKDRTLRRRADLDEERTHCLSTIAQQAASEMMTSHFKRPRRSIAAVVLSPPHSVRSAGDAWLRALWREVDERGEITNNLWSQSTKNCQIVKSEYVKKCPLSTGTREGLCFSIRSFHQTSRILGILCTTHSLTRFTPDQRSWPKEEIEAHFFKISKHQRIGAKDRHVERQQRGWRRH